MALLITVLGLLVVSTLGCVLPTTPELLTVWATSSKQLRATWNITQCGLPTFTAYKCSVQYFSQWDNIARTTEVTVGRPHHGSVSLDDLIPFTLYRLRVKCRKLLDNTWSGYTPYVQARTNATAPESAVTVGTPVSPSINYRTGRRNVTVTWEPLPSIKHNGILLGYLIRVTDLRVPSGGFVLNATVNDTTCTLEKLKLSGYRIDITAYNTEGRSPPATVEVQDIARVPDKPLDLTAEITQDENITLSWQPPAEIGGIEQYSVFWCELETDANCGGNETVLSVPGTYTTTTFIDSWLPFHRYRFNVRALTSAGQGPPSDNTYKYSAEGVPLSPPTNVTVQAENATVVLVSWQPIPLVNRRGLLTAYYVYYSTDSFQDTKTTTVKVADDSRPAHSLLTDLKPFTRYSVRISASTAMGEGNKTEPAFIMTDQSAPGDAPASVITTNITTNSFVISWSPPIHPNGIILRYNVKYGGKITAFAYQTEARVVGGLKGGTNYSVQVQACTGAVESPCGPFSPVKYVKTLKGTNVGPNAVEHGASSSVAVIAGVTTAVVLVVVLVIIAWGAMSAPKLRQLYRRVSYVPKPQDFITEELPTTNGKSRHSLDQVSLVCDNMAPEIVDNVTEYRTCELGSRGPAGQSDVDTSDVNIKEETCGLGSRDPPSQSEVDTSNVDIKKDCTLESDEVDYLKVVEVKDRFQDLPIIYVRRSGLTKREGDS
ncbi:receptor-type tyrosine-protein phosphatase F-like [Branchiostoma floridae]|uniref:Receptor-type tyrosine-protein phosphatase F-like n=1 Tax=Branchiostoma floridae TaxID=7739 RepID=A0A9J7MCB2_BRAFL|nr:receptor-type tyrosine-protein phosphatase F-like [Branchiostoma floridae]